jgi:hypothetical protein
VGDKGDFGHYQTVCIGEQGRLCSPIFANNANQVVQRRQSQISIGEQEVTLVRTSSRRILTQIVWAEGDFGHLYSE